jgi:hypothetical protein
MSQWVEKKADVVKHPEVLNHVELVFNEPPSTAGLLFGWSNDN